MAEALALGAGVVAFVQVADRIIGLCKFYIGSVRDAPHDLRIILVEISSLKAVLESLSFLADADSTGGPKPAFRQLQGPDGALNACGRALNELEGLIPADYVQNSRDSTETVKRGRRHDYAHALNALPWPLKSTRARKLLDEILQHKATITLAISTESLHSIKGVERALAEVKSTLTDSQRDQIHMWLERTNPSDLHNKACDLHEEDTGLWMLKSLAWEKWCAGLARFLWIYGIPGAGKTVMASFLVQKLPKPSVSGPQVAKVYYYCYFGHQQDETVPFLRWIVSQLCRQAGQVPASILYQFEQGQSPSIANLLDDLAEMVPLFDTVYVVVDAVDESKEPYTSLLSVLKTLATDTRFESVRLLATSREYFEIKAVLSACSIPVCMAVENVEVDIRTHVHSTLRSHRRFAKWPEKLRDEVEEALAVGAKGMFRWAVCQLDILRRHSTADAVRAALRDMPETLDETYVRIFGVISIQERNIVQRVIALICGHPESHIPMNILLQLVFEDWGQQAGSSSSLCDSETLQDICGCLIITKYPRDFVALAHFTVKEFLYSPRTWKSESENIRYFRLNDEIAAMTFLTTALRGAMSIEYKEQEFFEAYSQLGHHCLFFGYFSLKKWHSSLSKGGLQSLGLEFLNPQGRHYIWLKRMLGDHQPGLEASNGQFSLTISRP